MLNQITNSDKSQDKRQNLVQRILTAAFTIQAIIIGVKGNIDVLSGKPALDVIHSMIAQGVELILKAHNTEKRIDKKSDRTHNPNNQ